MDANRREPNPTRLELVWANKDKFLLTPSDATGKPVWVDRTHPSASEVRTATFTGSHGTVDDSDPFADNLLFTGDSLDVLRILTEVPEYRRIYRGKVKLVYIDPPFNTGQTFEHYDDWMEHSTWLSFMKERLHLIYDLLAPDGSIYVHLDDSEVHRMRCLLDEVFGTPNFVASFIWERTDIPAMQAGVSSRHDYILAFSRGDSIPNGFKSDLVPDHYDKRDKEGKPYCLRTLRMTGPGSAREDRPTMHYAVTSPDGTDVFPIRADGTEGRWRWGKERFLRDATLIEWVRQKNGWEPYRRIYSNANTVRPPETIWTYTEVGANRNGKLELKALFPKRTVFDTPKPERLLERIIHIGSNPNDIIVDVFAGSGTTAAVAHKMGRRWVTAEINPNTVVSFTQPRLAKVVDGEDPGGVTEKVGWEGGGGFRTVTVGESMFHIDGEDVYLAEWCTGEAYKRAVAGQLGYTYQFGCPPYCGVRGRMRLAVLEGACGVEEVEELVAGLAVRERVTIVAAVVLPGAEEALRRLSRGSQVVKSPRDLVTRTSGREKRANNRGSDVSERRSALVEEEGVPV